MNPIIKRLEVICEGMVELECEYGLFSLQDDNMYLLDEEEDEWEPIDWDVVSEDAELKEFYVKVYNVMNHIMSHGM